MPLFCIHNARLVSGRGISSGGAIVGDDGRIDRLLGNGEAPAAADTVIDARGLLLFPGFVDAHVHMRDPGATRKEDFGSGTRAAACGGVTTVMCMPNSSPPVTSPAGFALARAAGEASSHVDFALQAGVARDNLESLGDLWNAGATSFEALMSDAPENDRLDIDHYAAAAERVAALRAVIGVYAGQQRLLDRRLAELPADCADFQAFAETREPLAEAVGIAAAIEICRATGARTVLRQVSTARGFALARRAKAEALPLAVEATPHHLRLDASLLTSLRGFAYMIPPLRSGADRRAAVAAAADGTIDFVGSDHAPHAEAEKARDAPSEVPGGVPGLDTIAAAVLDLAAKGAISWPDVARLLAERPAELFGLAGRKGALAPGADGDMALVDPERRRAVSAADIRSRAGRSPFEGVELAGWPVLTALRGRVIAADGALTDETPRGAFLARGSS